MHLISALSAGVSGAEGGYADIYIRETTTYATWYSDFEGLSPNTGAIQLDQNGGAVVYVNETVTVRVRDSLNNIVRTFVDGVDSPVVEVKSTSFTGTNYTTGVTNTGEPATLQSVLDLWVENSGAPDWKVLEPGGTLITLEDLAARTASLVFNVKDDAYGAVGDGSNDDFSAIQAAVTAAQAVSGVVYFPAGTYSVSGQITVTGNVVFQGADSDTVTLERAALGSAAQALILVSGAIEVFITRLTLVPTSNCTDAQAVLVRSDNSASRVHFDLCTIGDASFGMLNMCFFAGSAFVERADLFMRDSATTGGLQTGLQCSGDLLFVKECFVNLSADPSGAVDYECFSVSNVGYVRASTIIFTGTATTGSVRVFEGGGSAVTLAMGYSQLFGDPGFGSTTLLTHSTLVPGSELVLTNNVMNGTAGWGSFTNLSGHPDTGASTTSTSTAATITPNPGKFLHYYHTRSSGGGFTLDMVGGAQAAPPPGSIFTYTVLNSTGANFSVTITNAQAAGVETVTNGNTKVLMFVKGPTTWHLVGTPRNVA